MYSTVSYYAWYTCTEVLSQMFDHEEHDGIRTGMCEEHVIVTTYC